MLYCHCFSTLLLVYAIRRVEVNQDGLKLNGIHLVWFHVDYVNKLGDSVQTVKKSKEV
jgi:hypothetical protein